MVRVLCSSVPISGAVFSHWLAALAASCRLVAAMSEKADMAVALGKGEMSNQDC